VITGNRAEYGLLRWLMHDIQNAPGLSLQLVVTGAHLSPEFGLTYREIEEDGFEIDCRVEILTSSDDSDVGVAKSMGLAFAGFADALSQLAPDLIVVLGDRYEIFSAVSTALVLQIPVAHLHGGELTAGAFDDALRHSITKMSHLHFVAAQDYFNRVVQLGEDPGRVFLVGGLGVDSIKRLNLLSREALETAIDFKLGDCNLLVTFHPPTLGPENPAVQLQALFDALNLFPDTHLIFTLPNSDTGGRELARMIHSYVDQRHNACFRASLGQLRYFSTISHVDGVVGNSSSGLTEVPSFNKATVNIGDRQGGRLQAASVINCDPDLASIENAIRRLYSADFALALEDTENPYGDGGASGKIMEIIKDFPLDGLIRKKFHDLHTDYFPGDLAAVRNE
jgi:GDP/UDP-N,N'-diacetylbacillosamine 2-epimerase (hydrolysing)